MSRRGYKIQFAASPGGPEMHRIRNFAEDLHRQLRAEEIGCVLNMDEARDEVLVEVVTARQLGSALRAIRAHLARSNFDDNISVVRLE